jgi:DNA repair protein RadA
MEEEIKEDNSEVEVVEEVKKKATKKKEEENKPQLIDLPGVGAGTVAKLADAGITDMIDVAVLTAKQLNEKTGMSEAVGRKVIQAAMTFADLDIKSGLAYEEHQSDKFTITTGSKNIDALLGGKGIKSRVITECYAGFGAGKSQLGMMLATTVQLPLDKGGVDGKCIYIDTEGSYSQSRVRQFAEGLGLDPEKTVDNIFVARAFNSSHQMLLLEKVAEMVRNGVNIKLMVIDSLTVHFRSEFIGRGELADRQHKLKQYIANIIKFAEKSNIAVYVTNQVMSDPAAMFGDPTRPVGGNIVGHASKYRLYIRKGKKDTRVCKLIDSPDLPDDETIFMIETKGFSDLDL